MIEYGDVEERKVALATMGGIEQTVCPGWRDWRENFAITNEDMERTRDEKAAAVRTYGFELSDSDIAQLKAGAPLFMGIDHDSLPGSYQVPDDQRAALLQDLA